MKYKTILADPPWMERGGVKSSVEPTDITLS
jgi:hypothetical protein